LIICILASYVRYNTTSIAMRRLWNYLTSFFRSRTWPRFGRLLALNAVVSLIATCIIWKWIFGKDFNLLQGYISIDFFNTLGVVFTIIGLAIALYQIAALRTENEIRVETAREVNRNNFMNEARQEIALLHKNMKDLQVRFNDDSYSRDTIKGFIIETNGFEQTLIKLHHHQDRLQSDAIIDCQNCVTLVSDLRSDLYKTIEGRHAQVIFRKSNFNAKIGAIINLVSAFESTLNA
jgi:hypothetical protein